MKELNSMSYERHNPLEQLSLEELRRRTSQKWQAHGSDPLPLWVAEMDVPLAPPVAKVLRQAIDIGDTGYASRHGYAEVVAGFAPRGGTGMISRSPIVEYCPT
jgi:cystathionine beta-lyase